MYEEKEGCIDVYWMYGIDRKMDTGMCVGWEGKLDGYMNISRTGGIGVQMVYESMLDNSIDRQKNI